MLCTCPVDAGPPAPADTVLPPTRQLTPASCNLARQGRPHVFCDMRIVDDSGRELPQDGHAVGQLQVCGEGLAYARNTTPELFGATTATQHSHADTIHTPLKKGAGPHRRRALPQGGRAGHHRRALVPHRGRRVH